MVHYVHDVIMPKVVCTVNQLNFVCNLISRLIVGWLVSGTS